jgi:AraC-like DNA-binding protein
MPVTPSVSSDAVFAGVWSCDGRHVPAPSIEPAWIVLVPRVGSLVERTGDRRSSVPPATALVVDAGESLALRSIRGTEVQATVVVPADAAALPFGGSGIRAMAPAALLAHHRLQRAEQEGAPPLVIEELALELVAFVMEPPRHAMRLSSTLRDAAHAALTIVAASDVPPSLAALAGMTGVTPWPLSRAIRAVLGIPLREYVVRRRLAAALDQLARAPNRFIGEVAHAAGFASHAHFTDAVRARFGIPPRTLLARCRPRERGNARCEPATGATSRGRSSIRE